MRIVFVLFLEEIEDTKKAFPNYLTFKKTHWEPILAGSVKIIDILNCYFVLKLPGNLLQPISGRFPLLISRLSCTYEIQSVRLKKSCDFMKIWDSNL